jgi:hypothetical protein
MTMAMDMATANAMAMATAMAMAMAMTVAMVIAMDMATLTGMGSDIPTNLSTTYLHITLNVAPVSQECSHPSYKGAWPTKPIKPYCCDHHNQQSLLFVLGTVLPSPSPVQTIVLHAPFVHSCLLLVVAGPPMLWP